MPKTLSKGEDSNEDSQVTLAAVPWAEEALLGEIEEIGAYSLLRVLGEGGMGKVYLARQQEPIRRVVALKVIKAGRHSNKVRARFEAERQVLALMRHPGIAQVYDAGTTPRGNPYYVMEYVSGIPITEFCDGERLPLRRRLELFIEVCAAIQHAHQRGVLHRDIKPQNVLVALQDGRPVPKVIDFGVAKAIGEDLDLGATLTEFGNVVGTPAYMSPEQADRTLVPDIDSRTDVYSLGVLLYELLVGTLPLDLKRLTGFVDRIVREDPPTPSQRLRTSGGSSVELAVRRSTEPAALARHLSGDLDWIVMKALEKDRARRYASVSELAADIERHLRDEPVLAGPPTLSYRMRKYVRRHKRAAAAAAMILLALMTGIVGVTLGLVRSLQAEELQRKEAEKSQAINDFLHEMLTAPDPRREGREVRVVEALDRAARDLGSRFADKPEVEAAVRASLGKTYLSLGELDKAGPHLERSLDLRQRLLGPEHHDTLESLGDLASFVVEHGEPVRARTLADRLVAASERSRGAEDPETLRAKNMLARIVIAQGKYAEAETIARETLAVQSRVLGEEDPRTLSTLNTLSGALWFQGKLAELEPAVRRMLTVKSRLLGREHPEVLDLENNLATVLKDLGKTSEAEALMRQTLEVRRRVLGLEHPRTLDSMTNLAGALVTEKRYADADALYWEIIAIRRRTLGDRHPDTLMTTYGLAQSLADQKRHAEAGDLFRRVWELRREVLGEDHPDTRAAEKELARVLGNQS